MYFAQEENIKLLCNSFIDVVPAPFEKEAKAVAQQFEGVFMHSPSVTTCTIQYSSNMVRLIIRRYY